MPRRIQRVKVVKTRNGIKRVPLRAAGEAKSTPRPVDRVVTPAQQAGSSALVTIEDNTIAAILADPRYTAVIPCLDAGKQALNSVGRRCGRCSAKRKRLRSQAMHQLKTCIAGLRGEQAQQFKKLLGAEKVRIYMTQGKGARPTPVTL